MADVGCSYILCAMDHKEKDMRRHREAFKLIRKDMQNEETKDTYKGFIDTFGDYIPFIAFQLKSNIIPPPRGFPFTCIKSIAIEDSTTNHSLIEINGKHLWCLYQVYPDAKRASIETAAKYGIILIKDIIPKISLVNLPLTSIKWKIQLNQEEYTQVFSSFKSSITKWVADLVFNGIEDLGHLVCMYGGNERGYISQYTPHVLADHELRHKLFNNLKGTLYHRHHFQELVGNVTVPIDCRFKNALQINFIIERPNQPNTFYPPEDNPVKKIRLMCNGIDIFQGSHDELYMIDKLIHGLPIPTHIAYYTYTFQTFENYKRQIGHIKDLNSIPIAGKNTLNMSKLTYSIQVELSPNIDPNSRIYMWILGVGVFRYYGGVAHILF
jgi:hypothetical protein